MFPELDPNLVLWLDLIAVVITVIVLILAYRREDLTERRLRTLVKNHELLLADRILQDMEKIDPEKAEAIRRKLPKAPDGVPKILKDPGTQDPTEMGLDVLLQLDRFSKTKESGSH